MTSTLDGHALAPVTEVAGASLPARWAQHPVVVAEAAHGGWDASHSWSDGDALLVRLRWRERIDGGRPFAVDHAPTGVSVLGVGDPAGAARLVLAAEAELAAVGGLGPVVRASMPRGTHAALSGHGGAVPPPFDRAPFDAWDWMCATAPPPAPPPAQPGEDRVAELTSAEERAEAAACLAVANPGGELPVDEPRSRWWGWRDDDGVVRGVAGASRRVPGRPWTLGSIGTDPAWRGRGIAAAVTGAATRAGLAESPMVTLGVYAHNAAARRLYLRLGFDLVQEFESSRP
ncbi:MULTISPECIES: GNAT family N-acetyltransferase [unclassified Isoptericola]|uniref:GNAT family N-acetyltransferase n=1 Tax=unclassified Isoptericola TaxID=2623355 RepID=UPI0036491F25